MSSGTGPPLCGFYFGGIAVNIFVYSDESGVFDKLHNDLFVFGGAVFLSKEERDICGRKYIAAERVIREREHFDLVSEVKATTISNTNKGKLYRSINQIEKFGVVINEKKVLDSIFMVEDLTGLSIDTSTFAHMVRKSTNMFYETFSIFVL